MPTLTFTARVYGTVHCATLQVIDSAYFVASNIIIKVRITQNNGAITLTLITFFFYLRLMLLLCYKYFLLFFLMELLD
jgi:hypothetical protein